MNTEIKWPHVAHMYLKSRIEVVTLRGSKERTGRLIHMNEPDAITVLFGEKEEIHRQKISVVKLEWCKPILRHREDITEEESREFMKDFTLFAWEEATQLPVGWKSAKEWAIDILNDGEFTPAQTLWLLNRGFDLFGLIESGQAIRKEVSNG